MTLHKLKTTGGQSARLWRLAKNGPILFMSASTKVWEVAARYELEPMSTVSVTRKNGSMRPVRLSEIVIQEAPGLWTSVVSCFHRYRDNLCTLCGTNA